MFTLFYAFFVLFCFNKPKSFDPTRSMMLSVQMQRSFINYIFRTNFCRPDFNGNTAHFIKKNSTTDVLLKKNEIDLTLLIKKYIYIVPEDSQEFLNIINKEIKDPETTQISFYIFNLLNEEIIKNIIFAMKNNKRLIVTICLHDYDNDHDKKNKEIIENCLNCVKPKKKLSTYQKFLFIFHTLLRVNEISSSSIDSERIHLYRFQKIENNQSELKPKEVIQLHNKMIIIEKKSGSQIIIYGGINFSKVGIFHSSDTSTAETYSKPIYEKNTQNLHKKIIENINIKKIKEFPFTFE